MEEIQVEVTAGHQGVFGPSSLTWRIHADPLLGLACLRALLMRALLPPGLSGGYATVRDPHDIWARLAGTLRYLGVVTYGSTAEAAMAGARVRGLASQIAWVDHGHRFRGDDVKLMLWGYCCQVSSVLEVLRRGGLGLSAGEQCRYLTEQVRTAAIWGLEPDLVPTTPGDLTRYFRQIRPELEAASGARQLAAKVVAAPLPELMVLPERHRPSWAPVAGLAFAALPHWARQLYGFSYLQGSAALGASATTVALHSLRDSLLQRP